jgi:hypothetical protein
MKSLATWLKGLIAAVVSAAANVTTLAIADPQHFDPSKAGWHDLGTLVVVSAVVGAALYLKQSPVPSTPPASSPSSPATAQRPAG